MSITTRKIGFWLMWAAVIIAGSVITVQLSRVHPGWIYWCGFAYGLTVWWASSLRDYAIKAMAA